MIVLCMSASSETTDLLVSQDQNPDHLPVNLRHEGLERQPVLRPQHTHQLI